MAKYYKIESIAFDKNFLDSLSFKKYKKSCFSLRKSIKNTEKWFTKAKRKG